MEKILLQPNEIPEMIRFCYESDADHMLTVLYDKELGLEHAINRTATDFIKNNVALFKLIKDNEFIGYFGEENLDGNRFLSGFFIMPEKRSLNNNDFWNAIVNHFNSDFLAFMAESNVPASKFLIKKGCKSIYNFDSQYGTMNLFVYKVGN